MWKVVQVLLRERSSMVNSIILKVFLSLIILSSFVFYDSSSAAAQDVDFYFLPANRSDLSQISTKSYIPASLVKLVTAANALFTFGENHKFKTNIYLTSNNELLIEGFGDPDLTSESLRQCLSQALIKLPKNFIFEKIVLDSTKYEANLLAPGQGSSLNPYDANVSALSINFNSVALDVSHKGVQSGENETPITNFAKQMANGLAPGKYRLAIKDNGSVQRQVAEVTEALLRELGFKVKSSYLVRPKNDQVKLLTSCNSQDLQIILKAMLKYSNNFTANQIYLNSGVMSYGYPASFEKSTKVLNKFLKEEVGVEGDFIILDGAGLSKENRLSPRQLIAILKYFQPYKNLLPEDQGVLYKSGTLNGVSNLAGYVSDGDKIKGYFSMFGTSAIPIPQRVELVKKHLN